MGRDVRGTAEGEGGGGGVMMGVGAEGVTGMDGAGGGRWLGTVDESTYVSGGGNFPPKGLQHLCVSHVYLIHNFYSASHYRTVQVGRLCLRFFKPLRGGELNKKLDFLDIVHF